MRFFMQIAAILSFSFTDKIQIAISSSPFKANVLLTVSSAAFFACFR